MRLIKQLVAVVAVAVLGGVAANIVGGNGVLALLAGLITATLTLVVYRAVVRRTENRPVTEVSPTGAVGALSLGALIGLGLFSLLRSLPLRSSAGTRLMDSDLREHCWGCSVSWQQPRSLRK